MSREGKGLFMPMPSIYFVIRAEARNPFPLHRGFLSLVGMTRICRTLNFLMRQGLP